MRTTLRSTIFKKTILRPLGFLLIILCIPNFSFAGVEKQITSEINSQERPSISGDKIVWQDYRNGNWDIYMYDLSSNTETQITTNSSSQTFPHIDVNKIVWQDNRTGNWDIFLYDILTGNEYQITSNLSSQLSPQIDGDNIIYRDSRNGNTDIYHFSLASGFEQQITSHPSHQYSPHISGHRIVWYDSRNSATDIFLYDLNTNQETQITSYTSHESQPYIKGDMIVYRGTKSGNADIYLLDLSTGNESQITTNASYQTDPQISGDNIVFRDHRNGNDDIYLYNLTTGIETQITINISNQITPKIDGDIIVWQDNRNGNWDIYMYDLYEGIEPDTVTQITTNTSGQYNPSVFENKVVWQDDRNGNWDIFSYDLETGEESQISSHTSSQTFPTVNGDKIVWEDRRNGNYDIFYFDYITENISPLVSNFSHQLETSVTGDRAVWIDRRDGNPEVYLFDFTTNTESRITNDARYQRFPRTFENYIIWVEYTPGNPTHALYLYNLDTGIKIQISENVQGNYGPAISDGRVAWSDNRNGIGNGDIFVYDIITGVETPISLHSSNQGGVALSGDRLVWMDQRNGNYDIYLYDFISNTEQRITTHTSSQYSPAIHDRTIAWFDSRNGNSDIFIYQLSEYVDAENPSIQCPSSVNISCQFNMPESYSILETFLLAGGTASDNTELDSLSFLMIEELSDGNTCPKIVSRTYQISDIHGNTSSCTQEILIHDITPPSFDEVPSNLNISCNLEEFPPFQSFSNFLEAHGDTSDNCAVDTSSFTLVSEISDNGFNPEVVTRTYSISDLCGNTAHFDHIITIQDTEPPNVIGLDTEINLVNGQVNIQPADVNNGSTDNCGIASMTVSPNSFDCTQIGEHQVELTVTDHSGNTASVMTTCTVIGEIPTSSIHPIPENDIYTGGDPEKLYLGYGPQSVMLEAIANGGNSFTYYWTGDNLDCDDCINTVFTPIEAGMYHFEVIVENEFGCTNNSNINICVTEARVLEQVKDKTTNEKIWVYSTKKVQTCDLSTGKEKNIQIKNVEKELQKNSSLILGSCESQCEPNQNVTSTKNLFAVKSTGVEFEVKFKLLAYPNPFQDNFDIQISSPDKEDLSLRVFDSNGRLLENRQNIEFQNYINDIGNDFVPGLYMIEISQGDKRDVIRMIKTK